MELTEQVLLHGLRAVQTDCALLEDVLQQLGPLRQTGHTEEMLAALLSRFTDSCTKRVWPEASAFRSYTSTCRRRRVFTCLCVCAAACWVWDSCQAEGSLSASRRSHAACCRPQTPESSTGLMYGFNIGEHFLQNETSTV